MITYTYDENGNIIGLNYNNTQYYYIRNGQNDVIGILDSNLNQVVSYEYDSWGNTISIKDANGNNITSSSNIGIINPYKYRSYRYDTEIGLYYLNSRYYNPEWGRFINFDNYGGQVGEILSHNGYAYCMNNPVNMVDENGNEAILTTVTGILVLFLGVATILSIPQERYEEAANAVANITTTVSNSLSNIKEKATNAVKTAVVTGVTTIAKTLTQPKKAPIVFPVNPYEFNPRGLTRVELDGTSNGRIIQWRAINNKVKFEWNEDFKNGPHYHITPSEGHIGIGSIHFKPLMKIPEPYRTIYFY